MYPWAWLMYHALDLGISAMEFWDMTPRAICILLDEMVRSSTGTREKRSAGGAGQVVQLDYIPRP